MLHFGYPTYTTTTRLTCLTTSPAYRLLVRRATFASVVTSRLHLQSRLWSTSSRPIITKQGEKRDNVFSRILIVPPPHPPSKFIAREVTGIRGFHAEAFIMPPLYFAGLFIALWTWKCLMMVLFQSKIIYMPSMPPNSRLEIIEDYTKECGGIQWEEHRTTSSDGTSLALCVASVYSGNTKKKESTPVYILYFQGNASSLPPRLPDLSRILRDILRLTPANNNVQYTMVCLSYRGYWTSSGRASEKGILRDTEAAMSWISQTHQRAGGTQPVAPVVVWGASIGAGFATGLAANEKACPDNLRIVSLCLETPFTSIRDMLSALYPQKWLPYKYLWPFLWNHLDSYQNLGTLVENCRREGNECPGVFILQAGEDEIVPPEYAEKLYERCVELGIRVDRKAVSGALHNDATWRASGRGALAGTIVREAERAVGPVGGPSASFHGPYK